MKEIYIHIEAFQKIVGICGAVMQAGLLAADYGESADSSTVPIHIAFMLLFLASARFSFLGPAQVGLFFALAAVRTYQTSNCVNGLGFNLLAAFIAFRRGWFLKKAKPKALFIAIVGCILMAVPAILMTGDPICLIPAALYSLVMAIVVASLAKGRVLSALARKKELLKLSDFKLTPREKTIVRGKLMGKTIKELAYEYALSESTVRNALSDSYHKLGIESIGQLMAIGERYRVE